MSFPFLPLHFAFRIRKLTSEPGDTPRVRFAKTEQKRFWFFPNPLPLARLTGFRFPLRRLRREPR